MVCSSISVVVRHAGVGLQCGAHLHAAHDDGHIRWGFFIRVFILYSHGHHPVFVRVFVCLMAHSQLHHRASNSVCSQCSSAGEHVPCSAFAMFLHFVVFSFCSSFAFCCSSLNIYLQFIARLHGAGRATPFLVATSEARTGSATPGTRVFATPAKTAWWFPSFPTIEVVLQLCNC
ncbi:hypothetical protein VPH35_008167 [Triticum aestivum]